MVASGTIHRTQTQTSLIGCQEQLDILDCFLSVSNGGEAEQQKKRRRGGSLVEMRQIDGERQDGSLSVCFTVLSPHGILAPRFTTHLRSVSTWLIQCSFLFLSDRNEDGKMNRPWQRRRSKGWTAFACFSGEKLRIFALESRHQEDKDSGLKLILLSSTKSYCSAQDGLFELLSRRFPYWLTLTNKGSFISTIKKCLFWWRWTLSGSWWRIASCIPNHSKCYSVESLWMYSIFRIKGQCLTQMIEYQVRTIITEYKVVGQNYKFKNYL